MKLKNKLGGLFFSIVIFYVGIIGFYFLPAYEEILLKQKEIQLESTSIQLYTMAKTMVSNGYTRSDIIKVIRGIRYGTDAREYVLLLDSKGYCVQHPTTSELDNKDVSKVKDPYGFPLVEEYLRIANSSIGRGVISYHWPWFNDKTKIEPKMAYVLNYEELDLVIISTAYINDVENYIHHLTMIAGLITLVITILLTILVTILIRDVLKSINNLKYKLLDLNSEDEGALNTPIPVSKDEIGEVATIFNTFTMKLRQVVLTTIAANRLLEEKTESLAKLIKEYNSLALSGSASVDCVGHEVVTLSDTVVNFNEAVGDSRDKVRHVSVASEQLSIIINEISKQTSKTQLLASSIEVRMKGISNALQILLENNNKIDEVVTTISKISKQTSMLALNSKIEAARFTINVDGFSVIADEINKLSTESASSVLHINNIVGEAKEQTVGTINTIKTVFEGITEIIGHIISIAAAIEEQTITSVDISRKILDIDKNIENNSNQSLAIADNVKAIHNEVKRVEECYDRIKALSHQMTTNVVGLASLQVEITYTLNRFKV